ncbi:IS1595 family transposase [Fluviicola sp.]|uniref:IS1595 family transposase n=1 Tax=Fluviicola sp. TaxID=1917219 RepID=UPI003D2BCFB9
MNYKFQFKNILEMLTKLPDEKSCREYLEYKRWKDKPCCVHCGYTKVYELKIKGEFTGLRKCALCRKRFTVSVGTIFEGSHIPLQKWLYAIFIFSSHKKGISSHQLSKDISITQKSAWFMLGRIRYALEDREVKEKFTGVTTMDESFVGGKNKNRHRDKKVPQSQGRSYKDKTPVFGIMNNGYLITRVIPNTKASTLKPLVYELVEKDSIIVTDEWKGYRGLHNEFDHIVVNHQSKQYSNNGFSSNDVENFWSHLKRGIYGIYHKVSREHLHRYTAEFTYRFNMRDLSETDRFEHVIVRTENLRLTYKNFAGKPS